MSERFLDSVTGTPLLDFETNDPSHYWRIAYYLNTHPEDLDEFFAQSGSLEAFARMLPKLSDEVAEKAIRMASRLILKIARQISDTGYRSGKLELVSGFKDGADIELDHSLERYVSQPERGILDSLASHERRREKRAFVLMLDYSYSMQSKIIMAAITAAAIAHHFKQDYALLAFSGGVNVLKDIGDPVGPEAILARLFTLRAHGETNIKRALQAGIHMTRGHARKSGLILTDGDWNKGGAPLKEAAMFDSLSVIAFPPAQYEKVSQLALLGKGVFSLVTGENEIAAAILRCLR